MKPKLYQYAVCPFCNKVAAMLAYKKVSYDAVEVNPLNHKEIEFSKDYRKVPIYIDSKGVQVNDSNQIMRHIDSEFPGPKVFSANGVGAHDEKWLNWSEKLVQGLPTVIYATFPDSWEAFNYITKAGNFSWFQRVSIRFSGALAMTLVSKRIRKREKIDDPAVFLRGMVQEWSAGLQGKKFMGGEQPSAADIAVFGICRSVAGLKKAGNLFQENAVFTQWLERMKNQTGLSLSVV